MKCDAFTSTVSPLWIRDGRQVSSASIVGTCSTSPQPPFAMAASAIWLLIFPVQIRRSILFFAAWYPTSACICSSFSPSSPMSPRIATLRPFAYYISLHIIYILYIQSDTTKSSTNLYKSCSYPLRSFLNLLL